MQTTGQSIDKFQCHRVVSANAADDQSSVTVVAERRGEKRSVAGTLPGAFPCEWLRSSDDDSGRIRRGQFRCSRRIVELRHRRHCREASFFRCGVWFFRSRLRCCRRRVRDHGGCGLHLRHCRAAGTESGACECHQGQSMCQTLAVFDAWRGPLHRNLPGLSQKDQFSIPS